jgi:hypothetical protein
VEASEINEIAQVVDDLQARLRVASRVNVDQPGIAAENIKLAKEVCERILKRLEQLGETI